MSYGQARKVRANARSVTGIHHSFAGPLQFESQLERDVYVLLEFEPWVQKIQSQPVRLANYVPDCLITTTSDQLLLAEVKYESELFQKWQTLHAKFERANKIALRDSMIFGFITDSAVYAQPNRLDVLKWIKFLARTGEPDKIIFKQLTEIFSVDNEIAIRTLANEIVSPANDAMKLQQICQYILSKFAHVKMTPTQDPLDSILCSKVDAYSDALGSIFIPYDDFRNRPQLSTDNLSYGGH